LKLHRFGQNKQNGRLARNYAGVEVLRIPRIFGVRRTKGRYAGETGFFDFPDARSGGMLELDPRSAFRSDRLRSNLKKGLLGSEMAARKSRSLVFGMSPTAALVNAADSFRIF
jgi:hypothetical protein